MKYSEIVALAEGVAPVVRELLDKTTAPLIAENKALQDRLSALERRINEMPAPRDGTDGAPGADGKSVSAEDLAPLVAQEVQRVMSLVPVAKDGADGENGKDADPEAVATLVHERIKAQLDALAETVKSIPDAPELPDIPAMIAECVAEAVAAIPVPENGTDGKSVKVDDVLPALEAQVAKFLADIPLPKDGAPGEPGKDGRDGAPGEKGADGADGVGLAGAIIDRDGGLVVTLTNGEVKSLGSVVGKDGLHGKNGTDGQDGMGGKDGLGFEDLSFDIAETGRPVAKFQRGDMVKTIALPGIIDRGVYSPEKVYEKGDAVSWGGSLWIAQDDCPQGKPDVSKGWRLAVKKGRDGRDGEIKAPVEPKPIKVS